MLQTLLNGAPSFQVDFGAEAQAAQCCEAALAAGWSGAYESGQAGRLFEVARLQLGTQVVPVRAIHWQPSFNAPALIEALLAEIYADVFASFSTESFVILEGFPVLDELAFRERCANVTTHKVWVGTFIEYKDWLRARLGPVAAIPVGSPVRRLVEHLLCFSGAPAPRQKVPVSGSYDRSAIKPSFDLGQLGVQAIETLLSHTRGRLNVRNVEGVAEWQQKDVDLLVRDSQGLSWLKVEGKTENHSSGNLVLEEYGNLERKVVGWFRYSAADILATCLWPTGELFLMDMDSLRQWQATTKRSLRTVKGTVPQQPYHSLVHLAPVNALLEDLNDIVYLRLDEWLPGLYTEFASSSLVSCKFAHKKLTPF